MKTIKCGSRSVAMATLGAVWMLVPLDAPTGVSPVTSIQAPQGKFRCYGSIDVPIRLTLAAPENAITPNANVIIEAEVSALADLAFAQLILKAEGAVQLLGPDRVTLGALAKGGRKRVEIPVRFLAAAASVVHVQLAADSADGTSHFAKNEAFYTDFWNGRVVAGMDGFFRRRRALGR